MKTLLNKLTSRKFLTAVTLVIAGLYAMFKDIEPTAAQQAVEPWTAYIPNIAGAITAILGGLGFIKAEADVDAAHRESSSGS